MEKNRIEIMIPEIKKLISNRYNPNKHLKYNKEGLLQFSDECPEKLKKDLYEYFTMRREDE